MKLILILNVIFSDKCTLEFGCFNMLHSHLIVDHGTSKYTCPYCYTRMDYSHSAMKTHLLQLHSDKHFEEFQCMYCAEGFHNVDDIREHMSQYHPSHFLFIGARRGITFSEETDDSVVQFVYIGESRDYSQYTFFTCADLNALNKMDAKELDPTILFKNYLSNIQSQQIKMVHSGRIEPISFLLTSEFAETNTIRYEKYLRQPALASLSSNRCIARPNVDQNSMPPVQPGPSRAIVSTPTVEQIVKRRPGPKSKTRPNLNAEPVTSVQFKCIKAEMANELSGIHGLGYRSRTCKYCPTHTFIKIDTDTGSQPFLDHLINIHPCEKAREFATAKQVIEHRIAHHSKEPIVYIQIEQSEYLVYKVVRCKFQCQICNARFDTNKALEKHTFDTHGDQLSTATVKSVSTVIESNDAQQPINSTKQLADFTYCNLFKCAEHEFLGNKTEAICHHNEKHHRKNFETRLQRFLSTSNEFPVQESGPFDRMHLFECQYCFKLFESMDSVVDHSCENREPRFKIEKLFACPEDSMITTFTGIKSHYAQEHPNKACTPANAFYPKSCGLCTYEYTRIDDLKDHYRRQHPNGEILTNELLDSMDIRNTNVGECKFVANCCQLELKSIDQIVYHVSICSRLFTCNHTNCMGRTFENLIGFVIHCRSHKESREEIIEKLHNPKKYLAMLSNMLIIFPNGLVVTMEGISDTDFDRKLKQDLISIFPEIWKTQRLWIISSTTPSK